MTTLAELHWDARRVLEAAGIAEAAIDARLIVEHRTGIDRAGLLREPERAIDSEMFAAIDADLARRRSGEPVHRIIGRLEFHGLSLLLSPGTLEPRDDTEALVELALPFLRDCARRKGSCRVLDLGTGTGAIALALLADVPEAIAIGVDLSEDALNTAADNAKDNGLAARFSTLRSDWFAGVNGRYDAIVSNPPYIRTDAIPGLAREVREFDPIKALDGGADGLEAYRWIAGGAPAALEPGGTVFVEIGFDQSETVVAVFLAAGLRLCDRREDLGGHLRALAFVPEADKKKPLGITGECS